MPKKPEDRAKMRMVHILIPEELHQKVRIRCAYEDRSIQDYISTLIAQDMKRYKPGKGVFGRKQ